MMSRGFVPIEASVMEAEKPEDDAADEPSVPCPDVIPNFRVKCFLF